MPEISENKSKKGDRSLWIAVIAAFVILISAWTFLIVTAVNNQPEVIEVQPKDQP